MINCDGLVKIYETDDKKVMALEGTGNSNGGSAHY